jgi:hypothetical protein
MIYKSNEEMLRAADPRYDYFCRHGRYPRKNWNPLDVPYEKRMCQRDARKAVREAPAQALMLTATLSPGRRH